MGKMLDLTGQKFGRLTALQPTKKRIHECIVWLCRCKCGNVCEIISASLRSGGTRSCGCLRQEGTGPSITHGYSRRHQKHPLYHIWGVMKDRCYNPSSSAYKYYGGRGITVCDEWLNNPKTFIEWALKNGWNKGLTLDRWPDNNGSYAPQNCRFATRLEQADNTRYLKLFVAYGPKGQVEISKNQSAFARKWDLYSASISRCLHGQCKIHKGWRFELLKKP